MCQQIDKATTKSTTWADGAPRFLIYRLAADTKFKQCNVRDVLDAYGCSCDGLGKSCAANEDEPLNVDAGA